VVVPAVLLLAGLGLGGVVGWRSATARTAATGPQARPLAVESVDGPVEQLGGLGEIAYVDSDGVVGALAADGSSRRALGHAGQLRVDAEVVPGDGGVRAVVSADRTLAYGYLADGSPVAVRLADEQARRLSPPGTVAAAAIRRSADGAVVAVCTRGRGDQGAARQPTTTLQDRDGHRTGGFDGCPLDLARDGSAALVPDPAARAGPGGAGPGPVRGVRLWLRSGGHRPVLAPAAALEAVRLVDPGARPGEVVVDGAWLAPDARRALVRVAASRRRGPAAGHWQPGPALVLVDLATRRWELVPTEAYATGAVAWSPTGGFAYALPSDFSSLSDEVRLLVAQVPPEGPPTLIPVGDREDVRMVLSPDGNWLLLHGGGQWLFIRVDDPEVRVSYSAPGEFAGWLAGRGAP
jgi:hypothetical protein